MKPSICLLLGVLLVIAGCGDKQQKIIDDAARHQRAAVAYQQQGQFRAAMIEARNAIQLQPSSLEGYLLLAAIYNQVGAYTSTQSLLEPLIERYPEAGLALGEAYVHSKKYRSALNLLNSLDVNTESELQRLSLVAQSHIALGESLDAEATIKKIRALPGASADAKYLEAMHALSQGKQEESARLLKDLLEENPQHLAGQMLAGEIALYNNQLDIADKLLTNVLTQIPSGDVMTIDRANVLGYLTQVLIQQGRTSEAYVYQKLLADANPEGQAVHQKFADAVEYYQQGNLVEAEKILNEIHQRYPSDKNAGTLLGLVQYQQGEDERALELFNQYIDPETTNASVIQAVAVAQYRTNRADEAIDLLKSATTNQPGDPVLLATYGLALLDRDVANPEGALLLEKSLALNPMQQRLRIALAKRYLAIGQQAQAFAQLQKAYTEQPDDQIIQQTYFSALLSDGQTTQARQLIEGYRQKNPNSARASFLEGWLELQQQNFPKAQDAFRRAIEGSEGRDRAMAYGGLAQAFEKNNQLSEAANTWQAALTEDPGLVEAYSRWLDAMQKIDKGSEAILYLEQLEGQKKYWQPSVVLAQLYFNQRQLPKAISHINTALQRNESEPLVKRVAANLYSQQGLELKSLKKFPEARVSLLKAQELNPDNIAYLSNLIDLELVAGRIGEAQKLLDHYPQSDENLAAYLFLQGAIFRADKKPDMALRNYLMSWQEKPSDNAAEAIYAQYVQKGQAEESDEMLDKWISALPQSPRPTLIKAMNAHKKNQLADAIIWYETTLKLAPDLGVAANNLAWIYHEQKDPRALEMAERAYDLAPNSADVLDTYGWILVELGRVEEGIVMLERAITLAPDNKEIAEHLNHARSLAK